MDQIESNILDFNYCNAECIGEMNENLMIQDLIMDHHRLFLGLESKIQKQKQRTIIAIPHIINSCSYTESL